MQLLEYARSLLDKHGYVVASSVEADAFQFEDDTLMGFVCEMPLNAIMESWERKQNEFLTRNARSLRNSALKSWNLYSVFLSSDVPTETDQKALVGIEEDFRATRKIVQTAIATASDVVRALYPFIPIQNVAPVETTDSSFAS